MNQVNMRNLEVSKSGNLILSVEALSISTGARVSVRGANGSGKTTLLRVLGGLESEFVGECAINEPTNRCVYVHQTPFLFRGTVLMNAVYGLNAHGVPNTKTQRREMAMHWLKTFGIDSLASRRVTGLSGGERRRVALARALAVQPRLLLLDEPLADLDEAGCDATFAALRSLGADVSVVIASPTPLPNGLCGQEFMLNASAKV